MPATVYSFLHIAGILMVFIGYGALLALALTKTEHPQVKKLGSITSGIGLSLLLVAGFGLIAKMGYSYTAPWLILKLIVWLLLGASIALINRKPELAKILWWLILVLGMVAVCTVYFFKS